MDRIIQLRSFHGSSATLSNSVNILDTELRLKLNDSDELYSSSIDGIVPPTSTTPVYTYVKNLRCYCPVTPTVFVGQCRVYFSNPSYDWDGIEIYVRQNVTYTDPIALGNNALSGFTHNVHTFTNSSPLLITDASLANPSSGLFGYYVQIQGKITNYARAGIPPALKLRFAYSEWL